MELLPVVAVVKQNILFVVEAEHRNARIVLESKSCVRIDGVQQFFRSGRIILPEFFIDKHLDFRIFRIFRVTGGSCSVAISVK